LDGRLVPKESRFGRRVTVLTALPMVDSALAGSIRFLMSGSGAFTSLWTHCRWRFSRWTSIGSMPAIAHSLLLLLPW